MSTKHTPGPWATLERIAAMDVTNTNAAMLARNGARDALDVLAASLCDEPFYKQQREALLAALRSIADMRVNSATNASEALALCIAVAKVSVADSEGLDATLDSRAAIAACEGQS